LPRDQQDNREQTYLAKERADIHGE
jgi:hypothetical protein